MAALGGDSASAASQPLLDVLAVGPGGITMSFVGTSVPVTSPEPEYSMDAKSPGVGCVV